MKRTFIILLALLLIFTVACTGTEEKGTLETGEIEEVHKEQLEKQIVKFYFPAGVPSLTVAKLVKENPNIDENIAIEYELQSTPDLLASKVLKEEADIAIVPSNLAAQLYNKGIPYKLAGTSVWGTLYLVGTEDLNSIDDLRGKEITSFGKNLTPDLVFKYVMSQNSLDVNKDIAINYLSAASEVGPQFISGKTNLALLSEPQTTNILMKKEDARILIDFNEEWSRITGHENGYPQASLIIKTDLIDSHRNFVEKFLEVYEDSLKWIKENPELAGEYMEELEFGMNKAIVVNGIDRMNVYPFKIQDSLEVYDKYYQVLLDFAPDVIGGQIPDEEFYLER
ncbi:MAG: ABC transporter substrate-binding protein [Tissierellia bacterium]|nr:ABC transporter substrate-binding protein [Tissierellia bacterium]